ncbi:GDNF family receptor alpha-3 [Sceloporus undulatus]|uniref:GDNF family receptor alpha-3 n=1 Tax=Sceloporus undulatus TaxID=8520 RepID=UPI001C4AAF50|nr:GDNF family receptor alpha-3 [Sceloporus undulatus]
MGLPRLLLLLLLGMLFLLSRAGGLVLSLEQSNNCITAENLCMTDPVCNATYLILQNCSQSIAKSSSFFLHHGVKDRCQEAETFIRNSYFHECKCHRRTGKQEERCLRIYWTVHSTLIPADFHLEMSPYEDIADEESSKIKYNKLASLASGSRIFGDSTNICLEAANICHLDHKCMRLRSAYAQICSTEYTCDQRRCHRGLRHFFQKVSVDFTKPLLFCPCQDDVCGERRWNTIVPECSFQSSSKPNCLLLLDSCRKDNICRSRLADFQEQCKPSGTSSDGCFHRHNHAVCLESYMGMIGTLMTPNYINNSTANVTLWCSCENSGNEKEDCDEILGSFADNRCLKSAIQSQMSPYQVYTDVQEQLQFTPSLNIQGDGTSTVFTAKMYWESEQKKIQSEGPKNNQLHISNSSYSRGWLSSFILPTTLLLLLLGPP